MIKLHRPTALVLAMAGILLAASALGAVAPEIRDDAKVFSPAALKRADDRIRDIYRNYQRDVLIETFAAAPAADLEKVKAMDTEKRREYFLKWAQERAKDRVVNGIYVLICKEPQYLLVGVPEKEPHRFAVGTREAIENALRKEFKDNRFDEGLEQALHVVEERLTKKQPGDPLKK
jgi:TPM domain